jgi:hypothetical protein
VKRSLRPISAQLLATIAEQAFPIKGIVDLRKQVKKIFQILMMLTANLWLGAATATEICVLINLSEQRAHLIEQGKPSLISPIASGKPGLVDAHGQLQYFEEGCRSPIWQLRIDH